MNTFYFYDPHLLWFVPGHKAKFAVLDYKLVPLNHAARHVIYNIRGADTKLLLDACYQAEIREIDYSKLQEIFTAETERIKDKLQPIWGQIWDQIKQKKRDSSRKDPVWENGHYDMCDCRSRGHLHPCSYFWLGHDHQFCHAGMAIDSDYRKKLAKKLNEKQ